MGCPWCLETGWDSGFEIKDAVGFSKGLIAPRPAENIQKPFLLEEVELQLQLVATSQPAD